MVFSMGRGCPWETFCRLDFPEDAGGWGQFPAQVTSFGKEEEEARVQIEELGAALLKHSARSVVSCQHVLSQAIDGVLLTAHMRNPRLWEIPSAPSHTARRDVWQSRE